MSRDPGDHFYRDVREQQKGFRKFTGGAGGMRVATIMLVAILAIGAMGMIWYAVSDRTGTASNPPPVTTGQGVGSGAAVQTDPAASPPPQIKR